MPSSTDHASLYERREVSASKTSQTETIRAASVICSPASPPG